MVICYTPRPRLQPQEEVVAVVTRKKCGFQTHGQRSAAAARHIQRHPEISGLCQCEQMNWLQELLWKHRKVSQVDSICQHFLPCWYRPAFREAQEKKRATFSTAVTCYYLFYPCYDIFIRQKNVTIQENTVSFQETAAWADRGWGVMQVCDSHTS